MRGPRGGLVLSHSPDQEQGGGEGTAQGHHAATAGHSDRTRARADAHLEALANLDPPHRAYFQNKGHLSQADTARAWQPYDDLPPGWEGVVTPNASVKGDWG